MTISIDTEKAEFKFNTHLWFKKKQRKTLQKVGIKEPVLCCS